MRIKNKLYLSLILLVIPVLINAASTQNELNITDAVNTMLAHNQQYQQSIIKTKDTELQIKIIWSQLMPTMEGEASILRQGADSGFLSLTDGQYDLRLLQVKFGINPGVFYNSLQAASTANNASKIELDKSRIDLEFELIKSYFDLLLSQEFIKLRSDSYKQLQSHLTDVENLYKNGSVPKFDLLQAQVQLSNEEPLLLDAKNNAQLAIDRFNLLINDQQKKYTANPDIINSEIKTIASIDENGLQQLIKVALEKRPDLKQLKSINKLYQQSSNAQSAQHWWPTLSIGGNYGFSKSIMDDTASSTSSLNPSLAIINQLKGSGEWENNWQVRAAATYRYSALLPWENSRVQQQSFDLKSDTTTLQIDQLTEAIKLSVKSDSTKINSYRLSIQSQKENIIRATEGLRIAQESYKNGIISNSDLMLAQVAYTGARLNYLQAIYNYYLTMAQLKRDIGSSRDFINFMENIYE